MKLTDFLQDEHFNRLRQHMGAEKTGNFELFDPDKQLTYAEREALEAGTINVSSSLLRVLKDKTLAYKNSRVWLTDGNDFHLAYCQRVQALRHRADHIDVGSGEAPVGKDKGVCLECLSVLQYQGVDARRLRRAEFSEQIREQFSLTDFKREYPFYPIV